MRLLRRKTIRVASNVALLAFAGCGGLEPVDAYAPITDPELMYMTLTLDHKAINLSTVAPYNSIQLTATPRDAHDAPMTGLPLPTFRSTDTTRIVVTADGMVQARRSGTGIRVIAELAADGNIFHADTAFINVTTTATPPVLDSLSLPSGATRGLDPRIATGVLYLIFAGMNPFTSIRAQAFSTDGTEITGLVIHYRSLKPEIADVAPTGDFSSIFTVGQFGFVATTTAYGVTRADTTLFTITLPTYQNVRIIAGPDGKPAFTPTEVALKAGGLMFWFNESEQAVDVTLDDPASATTAPAAVCATATQFGGDPATFCGEGNMAPFADNDNSLADARARQFNAPGTYTYRTSTGATGRIVVSP